jgi:dTDP-4-amino-4,6-dideoxygalactose transaminase
VALTSGTAALHLALILLGVGPGDEVLVPSFTFAATANVVTYVGATPVLVDSEAATWNIDPDLMAERIKAGAARGKVPVAVITVDLYGQCADYDPILATCEEYGIPIIEDAAEALGASYKGRAAGSFGKLSAFSFNGNKIITTSGGGMLVSDSEELIEQARYLSTQARQPVVHYEHTDIGFNYRLSNLLAALGRAQLSHLPEKISRRKEINSEYQGGLCDLPGVKFMPIADYGDCNYWLTCLTIDPGEFGTDREAVRCALEAEDIESRPTWKPLHLQPVFSETECVGGDVSAEIFNNGLCLPSGSSLTKEDQQKVIEVFRSCARAV